jgi:hypothetical protein
MIRLKVRGLLAAFSLAAAVGLPLSVAAQPAGGCPPGLAKKDPPCVPPGQAARWNVGDRYEGEWSPVDWRIFGLPRPGSDEQWIRVGDVVLKLDEETRSILAIARLTSAVLDGLGS